MKITINVPKGFTEDIEINLNIQESEQIVDIKPVTNTVPVAERIAPTTIQVSPNANTAPSPAPVISTAETPVPVPVTPEVKKPMVGGFVDFNELNNAM